MRPDPHWAVYLPNDGAWHDFWMGERIAPGDRVPLYVRAGSVVPLGPAVQYAAERSAARVELRVYTGASGAVTLYEEHGDSYRYERGVHATIPIAWDEAAGALPIGARAGRFPGMLARRTFRVVWVRPGPGVGLAPEPAANRVVAYDDLPVIVRPQAGARGAPGRRLA